MLNFRQQYFERFIMSDIHNPKNRKPHSLPILKIKITDKNDTYTTDPNGQAMMAAYGDYPLSEPIPNYFSEISGKPAYKYETDNLELALSFDELDRFIRHDLKTNEYEYLLEKYGMFHEIHEDFYWENEAQQPMDISPKTVKRIKESQKATPKKKKP